MSETGPTPQPEPTPPKKGLGDRLAETWEEVIKLIQGMSREQVQAGSEVTQQKLREVAEEENDTSTT